MAESIDERVGEGKLDLVPMIDCIMLLLLFFILTSKFIPEEKAIRSLLPTTQGDLSVKTTEKPPAINICIYPAGMERGLQPSDYLQQLREIQQSHPVIPAAWIRIGMAAPILLQSKDLKGDDATAQREVAQVGRYVHEQLAKFESGPVQDRPHQNAIVIHCFSGLSWKMALLALDAVRDYEHTVFPLPEGDPRLSDLTLAREVNLAPPLLRDYSPNELGNELYETVNMK